MESKSVVTHLHAYITCCLSPSLCVESVDSDQEDRDSQLDQKETKMFLKDYERKRLLERGSLALVSDSEEEEVEGSGKKKVSALSCSCLLLLWLDSSSASHCKGLLTCNNVLDLCRLRRTLKSRRN